MFEKAGLEMFIIMAAVICFVVGGFLLSIYNMAAVADFLHRLGG